MTFISQSGWTSINNPNTTNVIQDPKTKRFRVRMMDESGSWVVMGEYATEKRMQEILEEVRYHIREQDLREFRLPVR